MLELLFPWSKFKLIGGLIRAIRQRRTNWGYVAASDRIQTKDVNRLIDDVIPFLAFSLLLNSRIIQ